jgi:CcmD family protein
VPPDTVAWLGIGFVVSWVVIGAYLIRLAMAQRDVARRLDELSAKGANARPETGTPPEQAPPSAPLA